MISTKAAEKLIGNDKIPVDKIAQIRDETRELAEIILDSFERKRAKH